jgi:hypothetical protein
VARWTFEGTVSIRVSLEVDHPATSTTTPDERNLEYNAARAKAVELLHAMADGPLSTAAGACGRGGWQLDELEAARPRSDDERIDRAAVLKNDRIYAVDRPGRHDRAIHACCALLNLKTIGAHEQGFVTTDGRFVGREEAARLAFERGQIKEPKATLFSEDVW